MVMVKTIKYDPLTTAISRASQNGDKDEYAKLMTHGKDNYGQTLLHRAASKWEAVTCAELIKAGADVDATDINGHTLSVSRFYQT